MTDDKRKIAQAAPVLLFGADADGRTTWVDQAWADYTGQPAEPAGAWQQAIHPDDRADAQARWSEAVRAGQPLAGRYRLRRHDGAWRWHQVQAAPVRDDAGRLARWAGAATDVDELARAEARLQFLVRLTDATRALSDPARIVGASLELLREQLGADRCNWVEVEPDGRHQVFLGSACAPGVPSLSGRYALDALGPQAQADLQAGRALVVADAARAPRAAGYLTELGVAALVAVPLTKDGRYVAGIGVQMLAARDWTPDEIALVREVAERLWEAVERARIARALAARDDETRAVADNMAQLAWMADASGSIYWYNRRWYEFTGTTFEQVAGWGWTRVHHPDHVEQVVARIRRAWESGEPWEDTFPLRRHDGAWRWFLSRALPIRDESGRIARWFGTNTDVTEQREAQQRLADSERALRQSEERLRLAMQSSSLGWWYLDLRTGQATLSDSAREYFDLAGSGPVALEAAMARIHPDDRERVAGAMHQAFGPGSDGAYRALYRVVRGDGTLRWIDAIGQVHFQPIEGAARPTRFVGVLWDITEQQQTLEALGASEARLRAIVETVPVGIALARAPDGRITDGNRRLQEILRQPMPDTPGLQAYGDWVAFHADGRRVQAHEYPLARVLAGREARPELEALYRRGDGTLGWIRIIGAPIHDAAGRLSGAVVAVLDIDRERRALDALRQADARKDEFLAMLAHELRNPLAPLTNAHRLLARSASLDEADRRALAMASRQATHLSRLVDDLLEVSRITRGKIELRPEPVAVADAVRHAVESVAHEYGQRGHELAVQLPDEPLRVQADPARLAQVLENLLRNACKYTPDGGRIVVSAGPAPGDAVQIRVADNGIGIEPDNLERVFELFHQVDATLDRAAGGLGIGLAMVRRLVEMHGGTVRAESAGRGQGAAFTVRLLRAAAGDPGRAPQP